MATALTRARPPILMDLLAHKLRWQIVMALTASDYRVQELIGLLKQPANLVSYHLKRLRQARVVRERRSSADGRDIYYSLDVDKLRALYLASGEALHPALTESAPQTQTQAAARKPIRILFLCTHNSARSQMAEALTRYVGKGHIEAFSAGTEPSRVHPDAIKAMKKLGIDISGQRSKHLDEFRNQKFNYVITVCDRAREMCPIFPGDPEQIHWSFPDPTAEQNAAKREQLFMDTATQLMTRINYLVLMLERDGETIR